jgi:protein-tyrosine phosphatase
MSESTAFREAGQLIRSYRGLLRELYVRSKGVWLKTKLVRLFRRRRSTMLPEKVRNILVVCKGNICRSPLAEVYLRSILEPESGITVTSAGLDTTDGKPAHPFAKSVADLHGLTLECHQTAQITRAMVDEADVILVMESAQLNSLLKLCPRVNHKVFVLTEFNGSPWLDIDDPFSGTIEDFQKCLRIIRDSCDGLANQLQKRGNGLSGISAGRVKQ